MAKKSTTKLTKKPKKVARQTKATRRVIAKKSVGDNCPQKTSFVQQLNWYNTMFEDQTDAFNAVVQYLDSKGMKESCRVAKACKTELQKRLTSTDWAFASMLINNQPIPKDAIQRWHSRLKVKISTVNKIALTPKIQPQPKPFKKIVEERLSIVEQSIDEVFSQLRQNGRAKFAYSDLYNKYNITPEIQSQIAGYYKPIYQELVDAYKDRIEGYSGISKPVLKSMIEVLKHVIVFQKSTVYL